MAQFVSTLSVSQRRAVGSLETRTEKLCYFILNISEDQLYEDWLKSGEVVLQYFCNRMFVYLTDSYQY